MFELTNDLLVKLLLFVLVFFVTFQVMMKLFKQKGASMIIGLAASLLAVFYFSDNQSILLLNIYGTVGTILLILVPFLIAFFFIYSSNLAGILRKMFWIFYGIITLLILQNKTSFSLETLNLITLILIFALVIILFLDTAIKNKFNALKNLKRR